MCEVRKSGANANCGGYGSQFCDPTQLPGFQRFFRPGEPEPGDRPLCVLHDCESELRRPGGRVQS